MTLKDKVSVITGGGSGIGEHTALLFAENGSKIVITDINEDHGKAVLEKVKKKGVEGIFVKADSSKPEDSKRTIEEAVKAFGKVDIAVNNAGIGGPQQPTGEYDIEAWDKVISVNLSGVFYGMRYQIPQMLKNGGGSIINVASILAKVGFAQSVAYVAAKHGVIGLTQNGALEYASKGIRVNAVGPGFIRTPLIDDNMSKEQQEQLISLHPIGRLGKPEEVAELFLWLAGDKSKFVNGSYYTIDGGYLAQ
ncbi:SDR family oxidoreductase [Cryomorpha ignava]|uniref:SDR family oxidoreductase n=1 Tax=Cryomorpha ignava TaxID=101383 RepID=A0A7K3WUJ8_9FLAO|nr:SDR family oxidoreductase [Cryomorpha ignava]NEN24721.1 SDR family oxidoreductase [Cryomorpha ignava]